MFLISSKISAPKKLAWALSLMTVAYLALCIFYNLPSLHAAHFSREIFAWFEVPLVLFSYWLGYSGLRQSSELNRPMIMLLMGCLLLFSGLMLFTPPFHSTDIFGYVNRGWQQLHYGLNPYVYTINDIPGWAHDPMITNHWVNNPSPYGALYLLIAKGLCYLGAGHKPATVLLFKLSNLLAYAATAVLIWLGAVRLYGRETACRSLYLYAFNPLILIHGLANGHNDMLMGFLITLSVYTAITGAWNWILPVLVAATLVKYGSFVILPFAVLFLIHHRAWKALATGLTLGLILFLFCSIPFLKDWSRFHLGDINHNLFVSAGSLHLLFLSIYTIITEHLIPPLAQYSRQVGFGLKWMLLSSYMLFYGWLVIKRWQARSYPVMAWVQDAALVMAVLICVVSLKFYPWYIAIFFPLIFYLGEENWLRRMVILISAAQLFSLTFIGQAHIANCLIMTLLPIFWVLRDRRKAQLSEDSSIRLEPHEPGV
jgi:hypothetical protein